MMIDDEETPDMGHGMILLMDAMHMEATAHRQDERCKVRAMRAVRAIAICPRKDVDGSVQIRISEK